MKHLSYVGNALNLLCIAFTLLFSVILYIAAKEQASPLLLLVKRHSAEVVLFFLMFYVMGIMLSVVLFERTKKQKGFDRKAILKMVYSIFVISVSALVVVMIVGYVNGISTIV